MRIGGRVAKVILLRRAPSRHLSGRRGRGSSEAARGASPGDHGPLRSRSTRVTPVACNRGGAAARRPRSVGPRWSQSARAIGAGEEPLVAARPRLQATGATRGAPCGEVQHPRIGFVPRPGRSRRVNEAARRRSSPRRQVSQPQGDRSKLGTGAESERRWPVGSFCIPRVRHGRPVRVDPMTPPRPRAGGWVRFVFRESAFAGPLCWASRIARAGAHARGRSIIVVRGGPSPGFPPGCRALRPGRLCPD
jgi:hypothetical protein